MINETAINCPSSSSKPVDWVALGSNLINLITLLCYVVLYVVMKKGRIVSMFTGKATPEQQIADRVTQQVTTHINIGEVRDQLQTLVKKLTPENSIASDIVASP